MELAGGYVKIYRKLMDNPVWTQLSPAVLKVMIACLFRANWRQATWYDGHQQVQIPCGSFITSYAKMAEFCHLTVKQVRSAFVHLENLSFMACTRAQRWTLITVLNYETYQCNQDDEGTTEGSIRADKGQDESRQRATDEEVKNTNNTPLPPL